MRSIMDAVRSGNIPSLIAAIERESINTVGQYGYTVLIEAVRYAHYECLELILQIPGVLLNHRDIDGNTALHHATFAQCEACVSALLDAGIDVSLRNNAGLTASDCSIFYSDPCFALIAQKEIARSRNGAWMSP